MGLVPAEVWSLLVIKAMAALYELDLNPDLLFRLAAVVLVKEGTMVPWAIWLVSLTRT